MLVLGRKVGEVISIGEDITVKVVRVRGNQVSVGIEAPKEFRILRTELVSDDAGSENASTNRILKNNSPR